MAVILIVEEDLSEAQGMARVLRRVGHTTIHAPNQRVALLDARDRPQVIVLDRGLPEGSTKQLLQQLADLPETAHTPVVVIAERSAVVAPLNEQEVGNVVGTLPKPVSAAELRQAVHVALKAIHGEQVPDPLPLAQFRRHELIRRLIAEGPDRLAFHVYRRHAADRAISGNPPKEQTLSWAEIADWAALEGLLDAEQASLLRRGAPGRGSNGRVAPELAA
jgi:DNA-binding response OmpR family regulator